MFKLVRGSSYRNDLLQNPSFKAAEDKVYKVYSVSIKALRTLLTFTKFTNEDVSYVMAGIRPILHSILLKCADGQKRMAELSLETIAELCLEQTFQLEGHCGQKPRWVRVSILAEYC